MPDPVPGIDFANLPLPNDGILVTLFIINPGGPPPPDKPDISVVDYQPGNTTSMFMNLRVADIQACYEEWKAKGAEFVTPPIDRGAEIRCYMRDPDGYLIEVGQSTGVLHGQRAAKRPEDLPG